MKTGNLVLLAATFFFLGFGWGIAINHFNYGLPFILVAIAIGAIRNRIYGPINIK